MQYALECEPDSIAELPGLLRVIAGPVEATAIGNVMMQAVAAGAVSSIAEAREVIRHSFSVEEYEPSEHREAWEAAYGVYERLT